MHSIHAFRDTHIPAAIELWRATDNLGGGASDEPAALSRYLERNPGHSFVATAGETLIGTVLSGHDGRRGFIYHLAVAPEHRRRGLAGALLDRCLSAFREADIIKCHAFVFTGNSYAQRFWEPKGWQRRDDLLVYSMFTDDA